MSAAELNAKKNKFINKKPPLPVKLSTVAESPVKLKRNTIVLNKVKNIEAKKPTSTIIKKRHSLESLIDFCIKNHKIIIFFLISSFFLPPF